MRVFCLFIGIFWLLQGYALTWDDVWFTPDQQGQKAFYANNMDKAQVLFKNKLWQASAAYRSKDYQKAAELFAQFKTPLAWYNLGNALAKLGQYSQAIDAYNHALQLNPHFQDAIYNRDLLQKFQQSHMSQQSSKKSTSHERSNNASSNSSKNSSQMPQSSSASTSHSLSNTVSSANFKPHFNANSDSTSKQNTNSNLDTNSSSSSLDSNVSTTTNSEHHSADFSNGNSQTNHKNSIEYQQFPNAHSLESHSNKFDVDGVKDNKQFKAEQSVSITPKEQELKQWLQQIPDDPGGLLRNKFLRDHLKQNYSNNGNNHDEGN